ncbi:MAG: Biotin synthase [Syntrophus sp. PtaB.Bin001]|nr:MAG: Biotin synthase [Syntrophus sp. PtaB.Bin001]
MNWKELAQDILQGKLLMRAEALGILSTSDDDLLAILDGAFLIRRHYFGRDVTVHVIHNARSGLCTEDCAYCSQSGGADTEAPRYALHTIAQLLEGAREAHKLQALRYCVVTSGRSPSEKDLEVICEAVRKIKRDVPIQICTSLGLLNPEQATRLKDAGVDRFNHNLESSERFYSTICTTHNYSDRKKTAETVKAAGMELCSGGLIGMGETLEDRVDMAYALREVQADSIPLNFLDPRPGTNLENLNRLTPAECLRTLAMFRFVHPDREIRVAGGREACLGVMQVLSLYAANSIFTTGYLTTPGQGHKADMDMIQKAGFRVTDWTAA